MSAVIVIGSFNVDHAWTAVTLPRPGETLSGQYRSGPGGKGFNQATASARAGAATTLVCALGDDVGGQLARALAAADDIELRDQRSTAPTGTAGIFVDEQGGNSIVIAPGANATLSAEAVQANASMIITAQVVLAQLETPLAAVTAAFEQARIAGALTVLNPAPADAHVPAELLALAEVITPNETEFCAQLHRHTGEDIAPETLVAQDDAALHALCRRLLPHGSVVVTLGAAGCFISHASTNLRGDQVAHYRVDGETVHPIDTTGAGDAFNGALAASLALAPAQAFGTQVRFANRYAALSTEVAGAAVAMPRREAVLQRFGTA